MKRSHIRNRGVILLLIIGSLPTYAETVIQRYLVRDLLIIAHDSVLVSVIYDLHTLRPVPLLAHGNRLDRLVDQPKNNQPDQPKANW